MEQLTLNFGTIDANMPTADLRPAIEHTPDGWTVTLTRPDGNTFYQIAAPSLFDAGVACNAYLSQYGMLRLIALAPDAVRLVDLGA